MPTNKLLAEILLVLFALSAVSAQAKPVHFGSRAGFGFTVGAGVSNKPTVNYLPEPIKATHSYSNVYNFGMFMDFGNFSLEPMLEYYSHPRLSGMGADSNAQNYTETVDSSTLAAELRLKFIPIYLSGGRQRFYFGGSVGTAKTNTIDRRTYNGTATTNTERLTGSGQLFTAFAGFESFLVQNYAIYFEGGYDKHTADGLVHKIDTDSAGNKVSAGDAKLYAGKPASLGFSGAYVRIGLNIHF